MSLSLRFFRSPAVLAELRLTYPELPIIVMASSRSRTTISKAMRLGATGYIVAPFEPESFRRQCYRFFHESAPPGCTDNLTH